MLFDIPTELRYVKITGLTLKVKLNFQYGATGSGTMYFKGFGYTSLSSVPLPTGNNAQSGIDNTARTISLNMSGDIALPSSYARYGATFEFWTSSSSNTLKYVLVDYSQCSLEITHENYSVPAPTSLSPSSGTFNPGVANTVSWTYRASDCPNDYQTGSTLQYSINSGTWQTVAITGTSNRYTFAANTFKQSDVVKWRVMSKSICGDSTYSSEATLTMGTARVPTGLSPNTTTEIPGLPINASWTFNGAGVSGETQTGAIVAYSVNSGVAWTEITVGNATNKYAFPANTFTQSQEVQWRVRTVSNVGTSDWSAVAKMTMATAKPPETLTPNGAYRNPGGDILLTWQYISSGVNGDAQTGGAVRYRVTHGGVTSDWSTVVLNDVLNAYVFPAGAFEDGDIVEWQARTTSNVGTGGWSNTASFTLAITPPLVPVPVFPVGTSVNASNGVLLEWLYNSEYDANPSGFDIRYRVDYGVWKDMNNQGRLNILIPAAEFDDGERHTVEWRVKAYGEYGDESPWSETAAFWTVGAPRRPVIVEVTNSNLPTVRFAAANLLSWELEIVQNGKTVHVTGAKPWGNELSYRLTGFIPNGNYVARMRVVNEYGLYSGWAELAFTISAAPPEPLTIRLHLNTDFYVRLSYANAGRLVYIYRAEHRGCLTAPVYRRIAKTAAPIFDDYTAAPGVRYGYFARIVDDNGSYADSNVVTGSADFKKTTLAEHDSPGDMLTFLYNLGQKPFKNATVTHEKTLTRLVGRAFPLMQVGEHKEKGIDYTFYCSAEDRVRLEELAGSDKVLLLRDWRYGAIYGAIDGGVSANIETKGFIVGFSFKQCDFGEEVPLT